MDKLKPLISMKDAVDTAIASAGVSLSIAGILEWINEILAAGVAITTIIWLGYRIESLRHDKKHRDDDG